MKTHCAALALLMAAALPAVAQEKEALYLKGLAATCAACHGTNGQAVGGSSVVSLAGMPREQLAAQLKAFKSGSRPSTIMGQVAKGYSDAQIEQLAAYFASLK
jgi:sulfide dehydrogenase cytochrome subunit